MSHEGGESTLRLAQRIYNLLDEIREESDEKTYILVAHNGIARVVQSYFHDMTNEEYAAFGVKTVRLYDTIFQRNKKITENGGDIFNPRSFCPMESTNASDNTFL